MRSKISKQWDEAELSEFLTLTSDATVHTVHNVPYKTDLETVWDGVPQTMSVTNYSASNAPQDSLRQVEDHQARIYSHAVYKRLSSSEHFVAGLETFRKKHARAKTGKIVEPFAEFRFLHIVARVVGSHSLARAKNLRPKFPDVRTAKQAILHLDKLVGLLRSGIHLSDFTADEELHRLLARLRVHIVNEHTILRKPKDDATALERFFIAVLVRELIDAIGEASPAIICDVAGMIGYAVDPSTIERQIRQERIRHQRERKQSIVTDASAKTL